MVAGSAAITINVGRQTVITVGGGRTEAPIFVCTFLLYLPKYSIFVHTFLLKVITVNAGRQTVISGRTEADWGCEVVWEKAERQNKTEMQKKAKRQKRLKGKKWHAL